MAAAKDAYADLVKVKPFWRRWRGEAVAQAL